VTQIVSAPGQPPRGDWHAQVDGFIHRLRTIVLSYQDPKAGSEVGDEQSVLHGNIRFEVFPTDSGRNVCLIYETPNGSTNQIMISCSNERRVFAIPSISAEGETEVATIEEALVRVQEHIDDIPRQRRDRLRDYIDSWIEGGQRLGQIVEALNTMIQQEMKGGRITYRELSQACRYAVDRLGM